MKKILLGTTCMVAAGLAGAGAQAAEGLSLSLGGFYTFAGGVVVDEDDDTTYDDNRSNGAFRYEGEIHFKGETVLDNGLTVGNRIELEGQNQGGDQIDEAYVYFRGGFGELRFGADEAALSKCNYAAGNVTSMFGVDTPSYVFSNLGNNQAGTNSPLGYSPAAIQPHYQSTCFGVTGDQLGVRYTTPTLAGITVSGSYQPSGAQDTGQGAGTDDKETGFRNVYGLGAFGEWDLNGISWSIGGGGSWVGDDEVDGEEASMYLIGTKIGFDPFLVGGSVAWYNNNTSDFSANAAVAPDSDFFVFNIGGEYSMDAWAVGLEWSRGYYEVTSSDDEDVLDMISLNTAYQLGPGIELDGQIMYLDYKSDNNSTLGGLESDYDSFEVDAGIALSF
jgi:hypothetical protein